MNFMNKLLKNYVVYNDSLSLIVVIVVIVVGRLVKKYECHYVITKVTPFVIGGERERDNHYPK